MQDIAIISFAQLPSVRRDHLRDEPELVEPVVNGALDALGLSMRDVDFVCSGSSDYLVGRPFSFVAGVDGLMAFPPIRESHVEMDAAFALYEAWVRLLHGDLEIAVVYGFGKSSLGPLPDVLNCQNDPYYVQPLGFDAVSAAAMQAQLMLDRGMLTERDLAEIAVRNRRVARANPNALLAGDFDVDAILAEPYIAAPLRKSLCPPISDGACAVVLAAGARARKLVDRPAFIRGIDHRIEPQALGLRDLTVSRSAAIAAERARIHDAPLDFAELHAPFPHQERLLVDALRLGPEVQLNPSGGALAANPMMSAGLARFGEAAMRIARGDARRGVAHATSGACLQQNLVAVLEGA